MRRWIIAADDFAIDAGAVRAIVELIGRGVLTATSALVDAPLWKAAAGELPANARAPGSIRASIGLHLNLTQRFAGMRGATWGIGELILRHLSNRIPRAPVREAIERQLDAFEDAVGRGPDYVDGHQHVHQFHGVREELLAALRRRYASRLPWLRSTRAAPREGSAKARFIQALGDSGLRRCAREGGLATSAFLVGVYGFGDDAPAYANRLAAWFASGPDASVLMCHPAASSSPGDPIGAARAAEYTVLAAAGLRERIAAAGIARADGSSWMS